MNLVTTIAGGHYLTLVQFAAVATGLSFTSLTALNIGSGFCAVMDTLATQEHGRRRNSPEILKYLFRSLWWTFAFYIPVSILYWFSEYFLVYLIHEDLVAPTAHFLKFSFLIIIPMLLVNNLLKFSQCQHVTQLGVIASLLGFLTLIPLLILFKSLEINGIILALAINRSVIVLASLFYIVRHPDLKKTWAPEEAEDGTVPSTRAHVWRLLKESFTEWGELMSFGRKSLPILAAFLADSWAFELLSLLASSLSPLASATWSVLLVIYVQFFSLFIGTAIACAIRVGTSVGQGKGLLARRYALATIVVNLTMCLVVACFLWSGGVKVLLRLLQKNASVVEEGAALTVWVGFTFIGDSMFYATQGAFRGAGLNKELLALVFFSLWGIALPLALVLTKGSGNNSRRDEVGTPGRVS
ncbi:multidrug resistance protein, MATE family [Angomonas deanei]|uniref:MatE, putative n=1 Tax=Angomonas deanei TaxID=59799 RepID=A0A7G2CII0_9TRYP|nr:multidrug resistance protein, MATE family [Angomonas deanei]CAD2219576.1 MatE, putative [Angomonas deanei]|eukprot:EPY18727.1 multidrug resistance protein, MATE family [Angomonas deanei]